MNAWLEENLKAFSKHLGEWISWSYQKYDGSDFFNPLICISTTRYDFIKEDMKILVGIRHYPIRFVEVTNKKLLTGKVSSMQDQEDSNMSRATEVRTRGELELLVAANEEQELHASADTPVKDTNNHDLHLATIHSNMIMDGRASDSLSKLSNDINFEEVIDIVNERIPVETPGGFMNTNEDSSSLVQGTEHQDKVPSSGSSMESDQTFRDSSSKGSLCAEIGNLKVKGLVGRPKSRLEKRKIPLILLI